MIMGLRQLSFWLMWVLNAICFIVITLSAILDHNATYLIYLIFLPFTWLAYLFVFGHADCITAGLSDSEKDSKRKKDSQSD